MNTNQQIKSINPDSFYGKNKFSPSFRDGNSSLDILPTQRLGKRSSLTGPSETWKVFKKQEDLIKYILQINSELHPFTFQTVNGIRLFLAADPRRFWAFDELRTMKDRNTYEIIQENVPCKLYFDLEFDQTLNPNNEGDRMVHKFITLACLALKNKFDIACTSDHILNLNSSTPAKYSCHLIFHLENIAFCNNYNVGYFVKQLCCEIKLLIRNQITSENLCLLKTNTLPLKDIEELQVKDSKGNCRLFCDEGVYTKNRHFRLYKSSKFGKNTSLSVSAHNKHRCKNEEETFLHSLISYLDKKKTLKLLTCEIENENLHSAVCQREPRHHSCKDEKQVETRFPEIEKFINDIVDPGKIRRSVYFKETGVIIYEIIDNRFCHNIRRQHKSNNVKYIVDLFSYTYYQKCYDPDCATFRSKEQQLPFGEQFLVDEADDELLLKAVELCEQQFARLENKVSLRVISEESDFIAQEDELPSNVSFSNINEEDMIATVEQCEMNLNV